MNGVMQRSSKILLIAPLNTWIDPFLKRSIFVNVTFLIELTQYHFNQSGYTSENTFETA